MKFNEIKDLTVEELRRRLFQSREEHFNLKIKHSLGQAANPILIRTLRRDIARIKSALNMKLAQ